MSVLIAAVSSSLGEQVTPLFLSLMSVLIAAVSSSIGERMTPLPVLSVLFMMRVDIEPRLSVTKPSMAFLHRIDHKSLCPQSEPWLSCNDHSCGCDCSCQLTLTVMVWMFLLTDSDGLDVLVNWQWWFGCSCQLTVMVWMFLSTDSDGLDVQVKLEREWKPSSTISGECSFAFLVPSTFFLFFFFYSSMLSTNKNISVLFGVSIHVCVCVTTTNYVHLSCTHRHPVCVSLSWTVGAVLYCPLLSFCLSHFLAAAKPFFFLFSF